MPISVRPMKGEAFEVDVSEDHTVAALKERISELQPEMPVLRQKIIYAGRILEDRTVIKDIGIKEGARMVVMIMKSSEAPKDEGGTQLPPAAPAGTAAAPLAPADTDAALDAGTAAGAPAGAGAAAPTSGDLAVAVETPAQQLCAMGFDRADVERCLALAFGDANRAAEYLMGGIPPCLLRAPPPPVPGTGFVAPDRGPLPVASRGPPPTRTAQTLAADMEAAAHADPAQRMQARQELVEGAPVAPLPALDLVDAMIAAARAPDAPGGGWEVETDAGWQPWAPGVPFRGNAGEAVAFRRGGHAYTATFDGAGGVQRNLATSRRRRLRRSQGVPAAAHAPAARPVPGECGREALPPVQAHEVELVVADATSYENGRTVRSAPCTVGDFTFRLLAFPRGTASNRGTQVSAFVEADMAEPLDGRWAFSGVRYQIALVNWIDYRVSVVKVDTWTFSKEGIDRGWHDMVGTGDLSVESGWLGPNNSLLIRACVYCPAPRSIIVNPGYKSKMETGFVNLKANHLTHLVALLQSLYHIPAFRTLVRSANLGDGGLSAAHPALLLQQLFRELETSDEAPSAMDLVRSLNWEQPDIVQDFDPRLLLRTLCERVEGRIPGVRHTFAGEMQTYIECCDVEFASHRSEQFYGLRVTLQAEDGGEVRSLQDSLQRFLAEELLEGDNAYAADGHGKQRAKKGVRFTKLPPVLLLELGRTCLDARTLQVAKLNSRLEFPRELSLSELTPEGGQYKLHTVVVHKGDHQAGEYSAHIKTGSGDADAEWHTFTEDAATPCSEYAATDANFGGSDAYIWNYFDSTPQAISNATWPVRPRPESACALVYVRTD